MRSGPGFEDLPVAVSLQILDHSQAGLPVCNSCVHVMLLPMLIDREAFEVYHSSGAELRLNRSGNVDGRSTIFIHAELSHTVLDDGELDGDHTSDFNGPL